ncbi:response regulator [Caulobacter sp. 17J80-11]|uniref:response regulator n=1 Tax=Caulobacter sp. 17J80-11 TaxID=2763502 RepID=UPI0016534726|nr:response regulator [Caulobacter sp. 17J80-11]MBC6981330.1 response regulator [Caulobacter sp. 17J80-11]
MGQAWSARFDARVNDDAADEAAPEAGPPLRVLAADDHPTNRRLVEAMLGAMGVEVVSVEDGAQALAAFGGGGFDLVLMDLRMPVMDGLTAVAAIRKLEAEEGRVRTPILILSAHALPEHQEAGRAAGADAHLAKPVAAADLYAAMERLLEAAA